MTSKQPVHTVRLRDKALWLDDERIPLVSGEFHYWRVPTPIWPAMLARAAEMGFETISSYTSWHVHEYREGMFDFHGKTSEQTDLVSYLNRVKESGLKLIIRPGPYIFAEWDNYGIPDYLVPYHRQHPEFMAAASTYIKEVCEVIRPFLATRGGPVIALQVDNMFDLGKDRYDHDLGLLGGDGPFQEFLRKKYSSRISELNRAWKSSYGDIVEVAATTALPQTDIGIQRRLLDFIEFREWYTSECARWTTDLYRQHDIDVPMYSNATRDQAMSTMQTTMDFMSVNFYPTEGYSGQDEHRRLLDDVRLLSAVSPLPYVAELHAGVWHGYHYDKRIFQPTDCEFSWMNVIAAGAVGWNWYMLHDRDNWYMSPLNVNGRPRHELTSVISRCVRAEKEIRPWMWSRQTKTGITYHHQHHAMSHGRTDDQTAARDVGRAFYSAGIDYTFFVLSSPSAMPDVLFYDGAEWLSDSAYEMLAEYIEQGGHLVLFQTIPYLNDRWEVMNPLKIRMPDGVESQGYMNTFYRDVRVSLDTAIIASAPQSTYVYLTTPGNPIHASFIRSASTMNDNVMDEYQQLVSLGDETDFVVGYTEERGRGSISVLGLPPSPELVVAIHRYLGVQLPAVPKSRGVQTALYESGDAHYLIALNNDDHEKLSRVAVESDGLGEGTYTVRRVIGSGSPNETWTYTHQELQQVTVALGANSGSILEIRQQ